MHQSQAAMTNALARHYVGRDAKKYIDTNAAQTESEMIGTPLKARALCWMKNLVSTDLNSLPRDTVRSPAIHERKWVIRQHIAQSPSLQHQWETTNRIADDSG